MSEPQNRRVAFKTLGCKLNQAETESIAAIFLSRGWDLVDFGERADAIVLNSCTVTNNADRKSRSKMNRAMRMAANSSERPLLVFTGCHIDSNFRKSEPIENLRQEDVHFQDDDGILLVGNMYKTRIPELVDAYFGDKVPKLGSGSVRRIERTRALIKVQDGCDNFCSYCIVPFVRGPGFSRELDDCVSAIKKAVESGFREMVLTGINMGRWEQRNQSFANLLDAILACPGDFRLRLSSTEPDGVDERFIELMSHPKMANHLHLCLQAGSEKILRLMGRRYLVSEFEGVVERLREKVPGINITTDVIVGFPGETEVDFEETLNFCERLSFGHIHTFPYSPKYGTLAASMKEQIPKEEKTRRAARLRELSRSTKRSFRSSLIGSIQRVLVERVLRQAGGEVAVSGFSGSYVPVRFAIPEDEMEVKWINGRGMREVPWQRDVSNNDYNTRLSVNQIRSDEEIRNRFFPVEIVGIESGENPALLGKIASGSQGA